MIFFNFRKRKKEPLSLSKVNEVVGGGGMPVNAETVRKKNLVFLGFLKLLIFFFVVNLFMFPMLMVQS